MGLFVLFWLNDPLGGDNVPMAMIRSPLQTLTCHLLVPLGLDWLSGQ